MKHVAEPEFSVSIHIPWGGAGQFVPALEPASSKARAGKAQARQVYARPRIKLDENGSLCILNDGVLHLCRDGLLTRRMALPAPGAGETDRRILDFLPHAAGFSCLETFVKGSIRYNRLATLDPSGSVVWERLGLHAPNGLPSGVSLDGSFQKLLPWGRAAMLLVPAAGTGQIGCIDASTGRLLAPPGLLPLEWLQAFSSRHQDLVRIVFVSGEKRYGAATWAPDAQAERVVVGDDDAFGPLQFAYGVDDDLNIHTSFRNTQNKISPTGAVVATDHLLDLCHDPTDGSLLALRSVDDQMTLSRVLPDGSTRERTLEKPASPQPHQQFRIVEVQGDAEFHVHTGEEGMSPGSVAVFAADGHQARAYPYAATGRAPLGALSSFAGWQVAGDGAVMLPLTTQTGFLVVRWNQAG